MFIDIIKQESKKLEQFAKKNQCICDYCKKCGRIIYVGTEKIGMKDAYCKEEYCGCCWYEMSIIKDNDSIAIFQIDNHIIYYELLEKNFFQQWFFIHDKMDYKDFFIGV
jgi:hypothetical protein